MPAAAPTAWWSFLHWFSARNEESDRPHYIILPKILILRIYETAAATAWLRSRVAFVFSGEHYSAAAFNAEVPTPPSTWIHQPTPLYGSSDRSRSRTSRVFRWGSAAYRILCIWSLSFPDADHKRTRSDWDHRFRTCISASDHVGPDRSFWVSAAHSKIATHEVSAWLRPSMIPYMVWMDINFTIHVTMNDNNLQTRFAPIRNPDLGTTISSERLFHHSINEERQNQES